MGIETLAAASIGATVLGTGVSMMGAGNAAQSQAQAANYQAAVARNNEIIAQQYAERTTRTGMAKAEQQDYRTQAILGTAKAAQAASGVDVNSGSALDVRKSIAEVGELDKETIMYNAANEAYGFKVKAAGFGADAQLDRMKADNAITAGDYAQASSFLSGVSSVSSKWLGYQQKGTFS